MADDKIPVSRALVRILVSTLLISGTAFMGWLYYLHIKNYRLSAEQYHIVAIIQSTPQTETLKTVYLAELLNLSLDKPVNLFRFSIKEAERQLLSSPLIQIATIKKILPGTLYIDYEMRVPVAYLGDYANTALDEEGSLFPYHPFFTPKRLPTLYFGLDQEQITWGSSLQGQTSFELAFAILQYLRQPGKEGFQERYYIKQLDLSQSQADSYGQRQIVVILEELCHDWQPQSSPKGILFLR